MEEKITSFDFNNELVAFRSIIRAGYFFFNLRICSNFIFFFFNEEQRHFSSIL